MFGRRRREQTDDPRLPQPLRPLTMVGEFGERPKGAPPERPIPQPLRPLTMVNEFGERPKPTPQPIKPSPMQGETKGK